MDGTSVGISQISSMDSDELEELKKRMVPFLEVMAEQSTTWTCCSSC